mgnify:CR=1 FL=1
MTTDALAAHPATAGGARPRFQIDKRYLAPVLVTMVLSSFSGAAIGLALISAQRGGMKLALPFGTFLAVGAVAAMLAGDPLITWYSGFF